MVSRQIPNLTTLRPLRGNHGRMGRGGQSNPLVGSASRSSQPNKEEDKDYIVQQTDQDANMSRLSAVEVGYLDDPFAKLLVRGSTGVEQSQRRRFPIINRGTYIRTRALDHLITLFLTSTPNQRKQIISLGAGSDTRFFRLAAQPPPSPFTYHELDFPSLTAHKIATIAHSSALSALLHNHPLSTTTTEISLHSPTYHIHPLDLRTLGPTHAPLPYIDPSLPTLLISECCLVYLDPDAADAVTRYFTCTLFPVSTPLGMVLYEPTKPDDAFGKVMAANLAGRGIELRTLKRWGSLAAQMARMEGLGFGETWEEGRGDKGGGGGGGGEGGGGGGGGGEGGGVGVADVSFLWEEGVNEDEKARVAALEMMDELEEWRLLAAHYCVVWGWRNGDDGGDVWEGWRGFRGQNV